VFPASQSFRPIHRLRHDREFQAVFAARVKKSDGPLTAFTLSNSLPHHRLGLSIGRRVGGAVRRARLKRHLREAFRATRHELPLHPAGGYDIVIAAQKHDELPLEQYKALLTRLVTQCHRVWEKRTTKPETNQTPPTPRPEPEGLT